MRTDSYLALPQWRRLDTTTDGRLIATIARANEQRSRYVATLWELDPTGQPARQLTDEHTAYAGSTDSGEPLCITGGALRSLSADGTTRQLARPAGGVAGVVQRAGRVVFGTMMLPASTDLADDERRRTQRQDSADTSILFDEFPIQYWDHDLGPDRLRLVTGELSADVLAGRAELDLRDLTGHVGRALGDECTWDLSPDGSTLVTAWLVAEPGGSQRHALVAIDIATGTRRTLADSPDHEYRQPRFSPDGTTVVVHVDRRLTHAQPGTSWLGLVPVVLLPDFAMSTGYGLDFVRRGWGTYGDQPYTDVIALTDAACARPEIDADRLAVVGTSFGGYLANWIAGHTDRFSAIVTQAAPWQLDLIGESDIPHFFAREMGPAAADAYSPHHFADRITTPMLVVHGGRDRRVPVSEAHRLWWDLMSRQSTGPGPHRFLYFPDEGHLITRPSALAVWYETVLAFFATHLRASPQE